MSDEDQAREKDEDKTKKKFRVLHLMHLSGTENLEVADFSELVTKQIERTPDILSISGAKNRGTALRNVLNDYDNYRAVVPSSGTVVFAVRAGSPWITVKDHGVLKVHTPEQNSNKSVTAPPSYIAWVKVGLGDQDIWYHAAKWVKPTSHLTRSRHFSLSKAMAKLVRVHGMKDSMAFFAGDAAVDIDGQRDTAGYDVDQYFRDRGLITIFDEFNRYPVTYDGDTIDIVGSYDRDAQVKAARYETWPAHHGSHRPLSAYYRIYKDKGGVPKPFSDTRNWDDYKGNTAYELLRATDHEGEGHTHTQ